MLLGSMVQRSELELAQGEVTRLEKNLAAAKITQKSDLDQALHEVELLKGMLNETVPRDSLVQLQLQLKEAVELADAKSVQLSRMVHPSELEAARSQAARLEEQVGQLRGKLDRAVPRETFEQAQTKLKETAQLADAQSMQLSGMVLRHELENARSDAARLQERLAAVSQELVQTQAQLGTCVSKATHEQALKEAADLRDRAAASAAETERLRAAIVSSGSVSVTARPKPLQQAIVSPVKSMQRMDRESEAQVSPVLVQGQSLQDSRVGAFPSPPARSSVVAVIGQSPSISSPLRPVPASAAAPTPASPSESDVHLKSAESQSNSSVNAGPASSPPQITPHVLSPGFMPGASSSSQGQLATPVQSPVLMPSTGQPPPHMWV